MGFSGMLLPEADPGERDSERDREKEAELTNTNRLSDSVTRCMRVCVSSHLRKAVGSSGRRRGSSGRRWVVLRPRAPWPAELPSSSDAASQLWDENSKITQGKEGL